MRVHSGCSTRNTCSLATSPTESLPIAGNTWAASVASHCAECLALRQPGAFASMQARAIAAKLRSSAAASMLAAFAFALSACGSIPSRSLARASAARTLASPNPNSGKEPMPISLRWPWKV